MPSKKKKTPHKLPINVGNTYTTDARCNRNIKGGGHVNQLTDLEHSPHVKMVSARKQRNSNKLRQALLIWFLVCVAKLVLKYAPPPLASRIQYQYFPPKFEGDEVTEEPLHPPSLPPPPIKNVPLDNRE